MLVSAGTLDYGYPWWLTYGHVVILVPAVVALVVAYTRKWPLQCGSPWQPSFSGRPLRYS